MKDQVSFSELYDLTDSELENLISMACPKSVDFADIYLEYSQSESWSLEDGIVKSGSSNIDGGVGIRSIEASEQDLHTVIHLIMKTYQKQLQWQNQLQNKGLKRRKKFSL